MGALFLLVGCIATVVSWGALWLDASNKMSGQRAEGRITNKNIILSAGGDNDYIVEYWFNLPNENALRPSAEFTQNSGTHCVLEEHFLFCTRYRTKSATFLWDGRYFNRHDRVRVSFIWDFCCVRRAISSMVYSWQANRGITFAFSG